MTDQQNNPPEERKRKFYNQQEVLKYAGMAFQMGSIILIGAFAGNWLDHYFGMHKPFMTVLFALISIFAAFYITLKDLFMGSKK